MGVFDVKLAQTLVKSHLLSISIAKTLTELLIDILYLRERYENGTKGGEEGELVVREKK